MKKTLYITIALAAALLLSWQIKKNIVPGSITEEPHALIGDTAVKIMGVADEFEEQAQGLSGIETIGPEEGMLFVFPDKQVRRFWMKNMRFPLDIIWIEDNRVVNISGDLPPEGENPAETYSSVLPVNYVLEVNAGFTESRDIKTGDEVKLNYR